MKPNEPNQALLKSLGIQRASDLLPSNSLAVSLQHQSTSVAQRRAVLPVGADADRLIEKAIHRVRNHGLQTFMGHLVAEPEAMSQLTRQRKTYGVRRRYVIQNLRLQAVKVQYNSTMQRKDSEVLYAATLVLGIQYLLAQCIVGDDNPRDVMLTIARPHLHQLENTNPRQAIVLRQLMDWGNEDEVTDFIVELRTIITKAVKTALGPRQARARPVRRNGKRSS